MGRVPEELRATVEARLGSLHAVALLALGDSGAARTVTRLAVARFLTTFDPDEHQPARHLRGCLARTLLEPQGAAQRAADRWPLGEVEPVDDAEEALLRVLGCTSARDRLELGLVELEDLTPDEASTLVSAATRQDRSATVVAGLQADARAALEAAGSPRTVAEGLQRLVDRRAEVDTGALVREALAEVRVHRRRRRAVLVVLVACLVAAGVVAVGPRSRVAPRPAPTLPASAPGGGISIDGVSFRLGVPAAAEGSLPRLPDAVADTGLPETLAVLPGDLPPLTSGVTGGRSIRAVLVRRQPDGTGRAVLFVPRGTPELVEVADVVIPPRTPGGGPVNARTISDDRRSVVLPEADGVAVVDTAAGTVTRFAVPLDGTEDIGWTQGSGVVVVDGPGRAYRIDLGALVVQPMAPPGGTGRQRIVVAEKPALVTFDARGNPTGQKELPGPFVSTLGSTATATTGWSATGAVFASQLVPGGATHGLYAVSYDLSPSTAALVVRREERAGADCCKALAWAPRDRLLYLAPGVGAWHILAWDVTSGAQFLVSTVPAPDGSTWWGELAL